jgi:hypothetical protein
LSGAEARQWIARHHRPVDLSQLLAAALVLLTVALFVALIVAGNVDH